MKKYLAFLPLVLLALVALAPVVHSQCFPSIGCMVIEAPAIQTIGAAGIIKADACGSIKRVTAAAPVSTDTIDVVTRANAGFAGCFMLLCNVGSQTITLKRSANFLTTTGADLALAANGCVNVVSTGLIWQTISVMVTNS